MHVVSSDPTLPKSAAYQELNLQLAGLFAGENNGLANAANMCALLYHMLTDVNWVGFYFLQGSDLVLGPFQGKVACVRIELGRGVCGSAAERREILVVPDVHDFPGHIACDADSRSEIVVPLIQRGRLLGVLDVDSPKLARFDDEDKEGLRTAADLLLISSQLDHLVAEGISAS
ncbi:MAG: L-methionine (R)-S-oxide reductase [Gammaproteobacteria bacterium]|jgi:L-methionine (R)-S-oxide reductase|nr:L-methionine (R)-S-oxide reductase [Gammaproteobacteria bacterium]